MFFPFKSLLIVSIRTYECIQFLLLRIYFNAFSSNTSEENFLYILYKFYKWIMSQKKLTPLNWFLKCQLHLFINSVERFPLFYLKIQI